MTHIPLISLLFISLSAVAFAQQGNMQQAYQLYQQMTPEQRKAVEQQALAYQARLNAMTPEQREALTEQAADISETIEYEKIDTAKLNTKKIPSFDKTTKNFKEYEKKYEAGKIDNPVIKPKQ